jgi:hypothetical protein
MCSSSLRMQCQLPSETRGCGGPCGLSWWGLINHHHGKPKGFQADVSQCHCGDSAGVERGHQADVPHVNFVNFGNNNSSRCGHLTCRLGVSGTFRDLQQYRHRFLMPGLHVMFDRCIQACQGRGLLPTVAAILWTYWFQHLVDQVFSARLSIDFAAEQ